jgi:hypothetical protein
LRDQQKKRGFTVPSDIEIAREATLKPIGDIAARLGIPPESVENYGRYKAKISLDYIQSLEGRPDGKLILVTALSPTPAGEGKTTTTVGVGDALNKIGKKAIICLREPSDRRVLTAIREGRGGLPNEADERHRPECRAGVEGKRRSNLRPYQTGNRACGQHGDAARQIEESIGRAAQVGRRGVGDHGCEETLRDSHVHTPESDSKDDGDPAAVPRQHDIGGDQYRQPKRQQLAVANTVGKLAERIG